MRKNKYGRSLILSKLCVFVCAVSAAGADNVDAAAPARGELVLIENGTANARIVLAEKAGDQERRAAELLRDKGPSEKLETVGFGWIWL